MKSNPLKVFKHALRDGLGKKIAESCELAVWPHRPHTGIAYRRWEKELLLLIHDITRDFSITGDEYLDISRQINHEYEIFVAPAQTCKAHTYWAGPANRYDLGSPVVVLKFNVLDPVSKAGFKFPAEC